MDRLRHRTTFGWGDTAEPSVAKANNYMGGHRTEKTYTGRGGHRTYFLDWVNNWGV